MAVEDQQFDNLRSTIPNCPAHLHGLRCCSSGSSTMAQFLQADSNPRYTRCRWCLPIGTGKHIACLGQALLLSHMCQEVAEVEVVVAAVGVE